MGIDSNVIVNLYFWCQLLQFLSNFLMSFLAVGTATSVILIIASLVYEDISTSHKENVAIRKQLRRVAIPISIATGVIILLVASVQFCNKVLLRTEIARLVVPVGLDAVDVLSKEVQAMWDLLKGLLSK